MSRTLAWVSWHDSGGGRFYRFIITVLMATACKLFIMVMVALARQLVIVVTVAAARRPVIAVMAAPASRGGMVVIATLAGSGGIVAATRGVIAGTLIALGAHDLSRGGIDLHVEPVVERDAIGQHAGLAIDVDLSDAGSTLPFQRDLLRRNQIDSRLQQR
jgi:hypothetical protein